MYIVSYTPPGKELEAISWLVVEKGLDAFTPIGKRIRRRRIPRTDRYKVMPYSSRRSSKIRLCPVAY